MILKCKLKIRLLGDVVGCGGAEGTVQLRQCICAFRSDTNDNQMEDGCCASWLCNSIVWVGC